MAPYWMSLALFVAAFVHVEGISSARSTFKAAVYAHKAFVPVDPVPVSREKALQTMKINLDVLRQQAEISGQQSVDILVFPEDGVYGMKFNRQTVYPYLEYMPDPNNITWSPCDQPGKYPHVEVQTELSCMAKNNSLYLVANIGDKQPCDVTVDPKCPKDGRYQYNTAVAYGPDGTFLAKYHKYHLFFEDQFNTPEPTPVYFDTPFGRFGLMVCFDVLFEKPGITLVEKHNVTNIAFPTAWMDALPLLPAIGFHSSFARAHNVNFLSANIHLPEFRFDGSGLYAPDGARGFYYGTGEAGNQPKLVVSEMDVIQPNSKQQLRYINHSKSSKQNLVKDSVHIAPADEFDSDLFKDTYRFRTLDHPSGSIKVCQRNVCCYLDWASNLATFTRESDDNSELFAVGAFDGLHTHDGNYYMQNCALVKCANAKDRMSCGDYVLDSRTIFTNISLRAETQTPYVYPQIITSDSKGQLGIQEAGAWSFDRSKVTIQTSETFNATVLNAILVGRDYTRDSSNMLSPYSPLVFILLLVFIFL